MGKQDQAIRRFFGYHYLRLRLSLVTEGNRRTPDSSPTNIITSHCVCRQPPPHFENDAKTELHFVTLTLGPSQYSHILSTHAVCLLALRLKAAFRPPSEHSFLSCPALPGLALPSPSLPLATDRAG